MNLRTDIALLCSAASLALFYSGCAAPENARVQEKAVIFNSLSADDQVRLLHGRIELGDTTDMVYISLGKPIRVETGADVTYWIYSFLVKDPSGSARLDLHSPGPRPETGNANSSAAPIYRSGTPTIPEKVTFGFINGRLASIKDEGSPQWIPKE